MTVSATPEELAEFKRLVNLRSAHDHTLWVAQRHHTESVLALVAEEQTLWATVRERLGNDAPKSPNTVNLDTGEITAHS